mgnify:CR=1 FL=1
MNEQTKTAPVSLASLMTPMKTVSPKTYAESRVAINKSVGIFSGIVFSTSINSNSKRVDPIRNL